MKSVLLRSAGFLAGTAALIFAVPAAILAASFVVPPYVAGPFLGALGFAAFGLLCQWALAGEDRYERLD